MWPSRSLPQQWRVWIALAYVALLVLVSVFVQGAVLPPTDVNGLWFYAAFAGLLLGQFLTEPFFSTPSDSIANGVALGLALISSTQGSTAIPGEQALIGRVILGIYAVGLIAGGIIAISFKDEAGKRGYIAAELTRLLRVVGGSGVVFGVTLWMAAYASFANASEKLMVVLTMWALVFVARPLERGAAWWRRRLVAPKELGTARVSELHDPGLLIARAKRTPGDRLGNEVLDLDGQRVGRVVDVDRLGDEMQLVIALETGSAGSLGDEVQLGNHVDFGRAIGYVGRGSQIDEIHVRTSTASGDAGLSEGRLLVTGLRGERVYYQATGATIRPDESSEMARDILEVTARKVGKWEEATRTFQSVPWIPTAGEAVELAGEGSVGFDPDAIGHIPHSDFATPINIHRAVTHNTAVLGILGIGKTTLAFELVRRMLVAGIRVIVLDITDQYASEFQDLWPASSQDAVNKRIEDAIAAKQDDGTPVGDEAGNVGDFRQVIRQVLEELHEGDSRLLVLNPAAFVVTRRDGPLNFTTRKYPVARMTMVEVTRNVAEEVLALAQATRKEVTQEENGELLARFCLVLEEAHSLVPEWNSAADKAEQHATNGTVRAVLQGRKFGFGTLLVTQRTANVTKSVLNQCNTIIAMQIFDSTGMDFLRNYIGDTHARLLAALEPRHAVIFGRAFSSHIPLIVRLNDRKDFNSGFWEPRGTEVPPTSIGGAAEPVALQPDNVDLDDLPF